jgi:hypothetical protein
MVPGVDRIKYFGINFLTLLCKLGHFINVDIFAVLLWKDQAYKKE